MDNETIHSEVTTAQLRQMFAEHEVNSALEALERAQARREQAVLQKSREARLSAREARASRHDEYRQALEQYRLRELERREAQHTRQASHDGRAVALSLVIGLLTLCVVCVCWVWAVQSAFGAVRLTG